MTRSSSPARTGAGPVRRRRLLRLVRANLYDLWLLLNESRLVLAGFALLAAGTSVYLALFYPGTPESPRPRGMAEALYETLKLMTLQSGLVFPNHDVPGAILFFLTPLLGLALIFQSVLNFGRLLLDKGSRREAWQVALASTCQDHVIVCGLGRLGLRVATQLIAVGHDVVVIERDWSSEFVPRALSLQIPVVLGDAREVTIMRQAGVLRARAIVAAINDDLLNVEIALTARAIRPGMRVVLRVFNEELDRNLERTLGINSAFSASAIAAPTYAAATVSREIDYALMAGDTPLGVAQIVIQPESRLSGFVRAVEAEARVRVLSHVSQEGRHQPGGLLSQFSAGDRVMLIGPLDCIESLRQRNLPLSKVTFLSAAQPVHPTERFNTVIVCGLGKVGYRVVNQLHRLTPRPRIVVVRLGDGRAEFPQHISQLEGVTTVIGDARNIEVLRQAGLDEAYSVAALTSDDLLNVQIALTARRYRADLHIVLRTFSDALADKLAEMFGIHTTYSTSALAGPTLAAAALADSVSHAFFANDQMFVSDRLQLSAGHPFAGMEVGAIRERYATIVLEVRRGADVTVLPALESRLKPGDVIAVCAPIDALQWARTAL
ncbi:MAG: NAD-binding protein [Chloroflexi bacterium]|nr:NAD-binding protein [Chloroflexota bacterium]